MSIDTTQEIQSAITPDWVPPSPPTDLIFDDGEPLESNRHRIGMNVLIRSIKQAWSDRQDYFVGGNMFVYYSSRQARNRDFRGPDFFVVLNVESDPTRQGWVVWEEEGRYPDVIIELLSESTAAVDRGAKKTLYEQVFKTRDYFIFDPFEPRSLEGWTLDLQQGYQPLSANPQGWLWSESLGLWVGAWQGEIERDTASWLRFYDLQGNLVLLPEETERHRAEQAEQQLEQAEQQLEQAEQQLEQAEQQLEQERKLRQDLIDRLQAQGIDVDRL
jgi:Uma2 family endonuclease